MATKNFRITVAMMLFSILCAQGVKSASAQEFNSGKVVVVAVVEPRNMPVEEGELEYVVSINESRLVTTSTVLNGLGSSHVNSQNTRLAILLHKDISIGTLSTLISMASKAGYSAANINIYIFSSTRWMMPIPGYKTIEFTKDPKVLAGILN